MYREAFKKAIGSNLTVRISACSTKKAFVTTKTVIVTKPID